MCNTLYSFIIALQLEILIILITKMNVNNDTILDIAKEVQRLISELNRANLLNTVYVNENTHSRILKMILEYSHAGQFLSLLLF